MHLATTKSSHFINQDIRLRTKWSFAPVQDPDWPHDTQSVCTPVKIIERYDARVFNRLLGERGSQRRVRWIVSKIQSLATSKDQLLIFIALIGNWQGMMKGQLVLERNISQPAGHLVIGCMSASILAAGACPDF